MDLGRESLILAVVVFAVGLGVITVGLPLVEGRPADLLEEGRGEGGDEDGELRFGADEVEVVVQELGVLSAVPVAHGLGTGELGRDIGGGCPDGVGGRLVVDGLFVPLQGLGFLDEFVGEGLDLAGELEHFLAVVAGMDLLQEFFDAVAVAEIVVVQGGEGVFYGAVDGVGEGETGAFCHAAETGGKFLEGTEGGEEIGAVFGHLGLGGEAVNPVDEIVEGKLLLAGASGHLVEGHRACLVGGFLVGIFGNSGGFRCQEIADPGAGSLPALAAFDASVQIVPYDLDYASQRIHWHIMLLSVLLTH